MLGLTVWKQTCPWFECIKITQMEVKLQYVQPWRHYLHTTQVTVRCHLLGGHSVSEKKKKTCLQQETWQKVLYREKLKYVTYCSM